MPIRLLCALAFSLAACATGTGDPSAEIPIELPDAGVSPDGAPQACGPDNCDGCCQDGECVSGDQDDACGTDGASCMSCEAGRCAADIGFCEIPSTSQWRVTVVSADLPATQANGGTFDPDSPPDPAVIVGMYREGEDEAFQASIVPTLSNTLNPVWNHVAFENTFANDLKGLEFFVIDVDGNAPEDVIYCAKIDIGYEDFVAGQQTIECAASAQLNTLGGSLTFRITPEP